MKTRKSFLLALVAAFVLSLFLAACNANPGGSQTAGDGSEGGSESDSTGTSEESGKPQYGGDLIVGSTGSPTTFNDYYATDTASGAIIGFLFNGLITFNDQFEPVPDLAKDWEVSEDGLTYTFHLKEGVKFHDGEEMTAEDVVFSYNIPRSEDYTGPRASDFAVIENIEAVDQYTVKITLKEKDASFLSSVASYSILPKHILGDVPISKLAEHPFNTKNPIGTGPFQFVEWKDGQYVKVKAFEDYFEGRPYLDSVTYKIVPDANALLAQLKAGDIHYMGVQSTQLRSVKPLVEQGKLEMKTTLSLAYTYLGYNMRLDMFDDVKVRRALTHAIDREKIVQAVLNGDGQVAHAPGSPLSWAYNEDVPKFPYNPEKAKQLLEEAGWVDTDGDGIREKNGKEFAFTIKTNQGNEVREQTATVIQQMLKQVGVKATPKIIEWSAFIEQVTAPNWDFEAVILGWALGMDPDPSDLWHTREIEQGLNFVAFSDPELDKLMDKNTKILDQEKRAEVIGKIMAGIASQQPYTFLFYPNDHIAYTPKLHDVKLHPRIGYYKINTWWMEQ